MTNANHCASCHTEHQGSEFDPTTSALTHFDHSVTRFSLDWHQVNYDTTPIACETCHANRQQDFAVSNQACETCHANHDSAFTEQHIQQVGDNCLACHDGGDRMQSFDHYATSFPLEGKHNQIFCVDCHNPPEYPDGRYAGMPDDCAACHAEPAAHLGVFTSACGDCHTPAGWIPARLNGEQFDHTTHTGFSLVRHTTSYEDETMTCTTCHVEDIRQFDLSTCITCHSQHDAEFISNHRQQFGDACTQCHDGIDRMHDFDHANAFVLDGQHAVADCAACHAEKRFAGTPVECVQCHAEPEIHAGFFGLECQDCHTTTAWTPAFLKIHTFSLDHGGQGEISCQVCHPASYVTVTCYGCHDHQADLIAESHQSFGVTPDELPNCFTCHPTGAAGEAETGK